jgi:hypothetical protein
MLFVAFYNYGVVPHDSRIDSLIIVICFTCTCKAISLWMSWRRCLLVGRPPATEETRARSLEKETLDESQTFVQSAKTLDESQTFVQSAKTLDESVTFIQRLLTKFKFGKNLVPLKILSGTPRFSHFRPKSF